MILDPVSDIARAVLYEGYILYPYRPSSLKNRQRWTFGGVFPRDYTAHEPSEPCRMQTQCLLNVGPASVLEVRVRFLQLVAGDDSPPLAVPPQHRETEASPPETWDVAVEREIAVPPMPIAQLMGAPETVPFSFPGTRARKPAALQDDRDDIVPSGRPALQGEIVIEVAVAPAGDGLLRATVRIENTTPLDGCERLGRDAAQRHAFGSTHTIFSLQDGSFVSLIDPPQALRRAAELCDNQGTWPVLVGDPGRADTMLSSPIILYDYPQIAAESPGDLFDGTEIDEILILRILAVTDAEKREMAAADSRARALLERCEALTAADLARLHGRLRRSAGSPAAASGLRIGDHVRLLPKKGSDVMDIVLRGEVAVVEAIERDFENRVHVAVTVLADPGRDLGIDRMPGHRFFFALDEVELVPQGEPA